MLGLFHLRLLLSGGLKKKKKKLAWEGKKEKHKWSEMYLHCNFFGVSGAWAVELTFIFPSSRVLSLPRIAPSPRLILYLYTAKAQRRHGHANKA